MKKFSLALLTTTLLMTLAVKAATFGLGTTFSTESAAAGTNSVILVVTPSTNTWTASMNASWLHLDSTNGTGSATVVYSFDANVGPARTGTLIIAGQIFTVTQAGPPYVTTSAVSNLVSSGLNFPVGLAIDGGGNVFISDYNNNAIKKWNVTNNTVSTLVSSNAATPIKQPGELALDSSGNVCFADSGNNAIKRWNVTGSTMTTLVLSNALTPLNRPAGVALDSAGNVYIADAGNNAIKKWTATNGAVSVLVSSGLNNPTAVAVDAAGNVYIADALNNAIKKWSAANSNVTTVVSSGLATPIGVMVDGAGNLIIADSGNHAIKVWSVVSNTVSTRISTGLVSPYCAEVDANGSLYIANSGNNLIKKAPDALVDTATVSVSPIAGSGTLSAVLPVTVSLRAPFVPTSDAAWLTVNGNTNGVVTYSYTANLGATRMGNITVLGKQVPIRQSGPTYFLGTTNIVEGAAAGGDTVTLTANYNWTAAANASWLHLTTTNGTASTNLSFTFDANTGATRTGTLTIAGLTFTVVQVGTNYVAANSRYTLVSSGLSEPVGVALDRSGNAYIADSQNHAVVKWTASSGATSTLISSGVDNANGVAVDASGNVYVIRRQFVGAVTKWAATNGALTTVVPDGLYFPSDVAVDGAGNLYVADTGNAAIKMWTAANNTLTTLVSFGLSNATGVAVDGSGNVYIADRNNSALKKWSVADNTVTTLFSGVRPSSVAVDGSGNVYFADDNNNSFKKWDVRTTALTTLSSGFSNVGGVAVDSARNLFMTDATQNTVYELTRAWVDPSTKTLSAAAGSDVLPVVLPSTANLSGPFVPTSDSAWLTINGATNGIVSFSVTANTNTTVRTAHINLLGQSIAVIQNFNNVLGTTNLVVGPSAGTDSVLLASSTNWTAMANHPWLHLTPANQSGVGSTNVFFTFDANSGAPRTGTLTIGGLTLTVTQVGVSYVAVNPLATVISGFSSSYGHGLARDNAGNLYFADSGNDVVKKWNVTNNTVTTLVSTGLNIPRGVAVDNAGNVFIADTYNHQVKKWSVTNQAVTSVITNGVAFPVGLACDSLGNLYIASAGNDSIKKLDTSGTVTTLVGSGLNGAAGVCVDVVGNVFIADTGNNAVKMWNANNGTVSTLVSSGLHTPVSVAVDGSGNVYISDRDNNAIKMWKAATDTIVTLQQTNAIRPSQLALDPIRTLYVANGLGAVNVVPQAWVDPTPVSKPPAGGSDVLPVVLPSSVTMTGTLASTSDAAWLTVTGVTNGVVSYSVPANTMGARVGHITVLGQSITVSQGNYDYTLGTTNLLVTSGAGSNSVVLKAAHAWSAVANDWWLHLSAANQSGSAGTNVVFTFDANPGATRTGTLSIGNQTLRVTQSSQGYVPTSASATAALVSAGVNHPAGPAVDSAGNVIFADTINNAVKKWNRASNVVTTVISTGLSNPTGIAVDASGNIYIADNGNNAIKKWSASSSNVTVLVSSGLNAPQSVALDSEGNVYIADTGNNAVKVWIATNNAVSTLVSSGLSSPQGVAVDVAGNVYIADRNNQVIKKWVTANTNVITLVSNSFLGPKSVAVDGSGNVYLVDLDNSVRKWTAINNIVSTLFVGGGTSMGSGLAVDDEQNVYFSYPTATTLVELPFALIDTTSKFMPATAGTTTLPVVLPATKNLQASFYPTSDSPWLTVTGVTNGIVSFACTANTNAARMGYLTVLGQSIAVVQATPTFALGTTTLLEGPTAGADSVVLAANYDWTATSGASWLHVSPATQSGTTSTNVIFAFDSNPGMTRTGTLTIAGITLTVTQAGATYVAANQTESVVNLTRPPCVDVNAAGDVYFLDGFTMKVRSASDGTVTTLVSSGLVYPNGLCVDAAGNVYIADALAPAIRRWNAVDQTLTTVISGSQLGQPLSVAVDESGNLYIAENGDYRLLKWTAANSTLTTLVSGLKFINVAVDRAGNVYFAEETSDRVGVWRAADQTTTFLLSGINPSSVEVDGSGNVYFGDISSGTVKRWNATDASVTTLMSGLSVPIGVALDAAGNIYCAEYTGDAIRKQARAYVDPTPKIKQADAGTDSLSVVLPAIQNFSAPFTPSSDVPWLTISGINNGIVSFAFDSTTTNRNGHLSIFGQSIAVTQVGLPILLQPAVLTDGEFRIAFTNAPGSSFNILSSTNLALPLTNWTVLGVATENPPGTYRFTNAVNLSDPSRFYIIRQP